MKLFALSFEVCRDRIGFRLKPWRRRLRHSQPLLIALSIIASTLSNAIAQESIVSLKDEIDISVDRGIDYLISKQRSDGSIVDRGYATAMTALSVMAIASTGTTVSEPTPRGRAMLRAVNYILRDDVRDNQGYFGQKDDSRMYGHGIITLMLTELVGMGISDEQDAKLHKCCREGIALILRSQQVPKSAMHRGGWRYTPDASDSDLSVSVWQLMALRSAKNDGLEVPSGAIDDAVDYLERSFTSSLDRTGRPIEVGGFAYTATQKNATFTMTSAGLLALQVCGRYESPMVISASDWLVANPPKWGDRFFFYGTYYYAQGMYQRAGTYAKTADEAVQKILLEKQQADGSWIAQGGEEAGPGTVYSTSLAILSLSVKYHYLPIYQR
ncbi:MAG: prenyltransferase/squalene oxidase repeat-containing protein [Pirellulaceae bacterium]|nr:prenyltransferase/squalene oxidase repeat-containing protein [Pirellulaceae bacterium]